MEQVKSVLITGISGFIGKLTVSYLARKNYNVTGIVRPGTSSAQLEHIPESVTLHELNLDDSKGLNDFLNKHNFDCVLHIGALRGGRKYSKNTFYAVNVTSTQLIMEYCFKHKARLVFCSSVGVFGAIPEELPANNYTRKRNDNYYHYTKIVCEEMIANRVLEGLDAIVVRPAITYGEGDYGFPYTLTKLIDKKLLRFPNQPVRIHMTNANTLAQIIARLVETNVTPGTEFIVADKEPVLLAELVKFISNQLHGADYPANREIQVKWFRLGEAIARTMKNELWISRFELLSRSWYFDTSEVYKQLDMQPEKTIPSFKTVINWYKKH
ncbi:MAG: NAD(P)-dependent oxidoreductase [Candidatus Cloacimonetes bacterium]|nr:NAD(P)-dependent oxidoreductase [Candidatus Cloacimonadota bacterium]